MDLYKLFNVVNAGLVRCARLSFEILKDHLCLTYRRVSISWRYYSLLQCHGWFGCYGLYVLELPTHALERVLLIDSLGQGPSRGIEISS